MSEDWSRGDPYKRARERREILFFVGSLAAPLAIVAIAPATIGAVFGSISWLVPAGVVAVIVAARALMMPAVLNDGEGWGMNRRGRVLFRLLWLPVGIEASR